ncbi:acetyltransferase [Alicyclobacillus ferrooxydans]|uniref:PglD N-terminal domain-containing protein n=1 Tax=Alicyclobacillus ferrooxydans TaxID=471514 RepID=A0A0N8PPH9_9BACL|nr:acetyltransferase [Alicyclobacillus ferrooxydans]KPV44373.1 hypothetical protein AN477_06995 [Alicyclobacillus ferrooxydans]
MRTVIIGGGGHAKVVIDSFRRAYPECELVGVVDDCPQLSGGKVLGVPVIGHLAMLGHIRDSVDFAFIAIGDNQIRESIALKIRHLQFDFPVLVHPSAVVSSSVEIGAGTFVAAGTVLQPDIRVGAHSILNTGATIDHDCHIGDFVHICPGVHLAGAVSVGHSAHVGIGSSVIQTVSIGNSAYIGAGSTVVHDIGPGVLAYGTPCRVIRHCE